MFYLTILGKENIDKEYPIMCWKDTYIHIIVCCVLDFVISTSVMFIVFYNVMTEKHYHYYINAMIVLLIVHININTILTLITTTSCKISHDRSIMSVVNRGRYKLGIFENGSIFRHVFILPIINSIINVIGISCSIILTNAPYNDITRQQMLLAFLIMWPLCTIYGVIVMVIKYYDTNWFSNKSIIRPFFIRDDDKADDDMDNPSLEI